MHKCLKTAWRDLLRQQKERIKTEYLTRTLKATEMGPKKTPSQDPADPEAEKQFREERIARELFQTEIWTQLPKPTKKIVDIDDENATLASMINNQTLVPPENPRDPGSQLYHRILYVFGMTAKLMSILRRMRYFSEEQIDENINWFNDTFAGTVTRVKEISYMKTTFGPRMSGLHKHTKLMEAESVAFNEHRLIQEWVDEKEIKYPYTLLDLGNRKYKQTIARTGFTKDIIAELMKRGFPRVQVDKHIKQIRHRFSFDVRRSGKKGKHTPPAKLPEIIFTEEKGESVPTTTGVTVSTTSSATPATPSTSKSTPPIGTDTGTTEQTIGKITIPDPGGAPGEKGHLAIISTIFSLSTAGDAEDPEEQEMELEYVSTVTKDFESYDPKADLTGQDLQIKKEMVEEDLHPGDPEYYSCLQYVYQNLQKAEETVEASKGTMSYNDNLKNCNSINQIFGNMKTAYIHHAERTGKVLPEGWDTVKLAKPIPPRLAKGMQIPVEEGLDYHPVPISHLNPKTMGLKQIEDYMDMFDKEVEELNKIRETGTAKEYTRAKMNRREKLENNFTEFEIE